MLHDMWFESCKAGDVSSWERMTRRFSRLVYSVPRRMGLSGEACDDVFQDTFLALYQRLDSIKDGSAVASWLVTTARRHALRQRERLNRELPIESESPARADQDEETTVDLLCDNSLKEKISAAMAELPEANRKLLHLLFYEDLSYADAASSLGCAVGSVGPVRRRSLERLTAQLCGIAGQSCRHETLGSTGAHCAGCPQSQELRALLIH